VKHICKIACGMMLFLWSVIDLPHPSFAQGFGQINGTVSDSTGAIIAGAQVKAIAAATGDTTTVFTNNSGAYVFASLRPTTYDIQASAGGFSRYSAAHIVLLTDQALTVNVVLQPGSTSETVVVTTEAAQVDTSTGTLSQVIDQQRMMDMPLNGRNAASLTTLVAGVVSASSLNIDQGNTKTFPEVAAVSVSGTRATQINYMLDGGNNVDGYTSVNDPFPMPDSLQEFSVQTSNFNAEYGQNAGGVVNITTKSGTKQFHGDLFEFVRNRVFNAANFFSYANGVKTVDPLKRNQFGGTVGGPVKLPWTSWSPIKLNNAFFFFGAQKTIQHNQSNSGSATVPTTDQLNGIFAGLQNPIVNPDTNVDYPYTQTGSTYTSTLPTKSYNSASLALLKYLPSRTTQGLVYYVVPSQYEYNEVTARFDQAIKSKDHLTARYFYDVFDKEGVLDLTNLLTYADMSNIAYHNAILSETHVFSSSLINNFIVDYQFENSTRGPISNSIDVADLGVNIWQPSIKQINSISVSDNFGIGDNPYASFRRNNYSLSDNIHWVKGHHNFSAGFHGELAKMDIANQYRQPGTFSFSSTTTGNSMASFLLGRISQFQQSSGQYFNNRYKIFGFYAQDSWKFTPRLTINYGLRYEPFRPEHEKMHRMGEFSTAAWTAGTVSSIYPNAPAGLLFPGDNGFVDGVHPSWSHVMPRFGFAWDVHGNGKLSLRGGGGIFYESRLPASLNNVFASSSPFVTTVSNTYSGSALGNFSDPYANISGGNPFPVTSSSWKNATFPTQNYASFDPNRFKVPVTYAWNLTLEQQYTHALSSRIAYVGTRATHQSGSLDINPTWNQGANVGKRLYYSSNSVQNYTQQISMVDTGSNTNYHGLQTTLQERAAAGLNLFFNWTWSKANDNLTWGSNEGGIASGASYVLPVYEHDYKRLDRGRSDSDYRHIISASYVWSIPKLHRGNTIVRYIEMNWQTSGIVSRNSSSGVTASTGNWNSGTSLGRERGILSGNAPYGNGACAGVTGTCKSWLNPSSFSVNPYYTVSVPLSYGTSIKNSLKGPSGSGWSTSLQRTFDLHKSTNLDFRAEFFNVLNHTVFNGPNTTVGSSTFGRITSANDPRIGQLSMRLNF